MARSENREAPFMQRVYDRVWLLALLAVAFWALAYVAWGLVEVLGVPSG